jgi:hypothetical protein
LFSAGLAQHPSLLRIDLQQATGLDAAAVGQFLGCSLLLLELNLSSTGLGPEGTEQLATAVLAARLSSSNQGAAVEQASAALTTAARGARTAAAAAVAVPQPAAGFMSFIFSGNSPGPTAAAALGRALAAVISSSSSSPMSSTFSSSSSSSSRRRDVSAGSRCGFSLLDLSQNDLGSDGLAALVAGLVEGKGGGQLLQLDVQGNNVKGRYY